MELLVFPVIMIALTWLLLVRPQQRRLKEREALVMSVRPGERVVTAGGLHGTVVALDGEEATLSLAPGFEVTIDRRAIGRVAARVDGGVPGDDGDLGDDAAEDDR